MADMTALRTWFRAYCRAPIGAVVAMLSFSLVNGGIDFSPSVNKLRGIGGMLAVALIVAYTVGLLLLPMYLLFERWGWRGWSTYVPTAVVAGALTAIAMEWPEVGHGTAAYYYMCCLNGLFCGVVFSATLRRAA